MKPATRWMAVMIGCLLAQSVVAGDRADAYRSEVTDRDGSRFKLNNEAVVRISATGAAGNIQASSQECVLFEQGLRWKIWIENDGLFDCDLEQRPKGMARQAELTRIQEVKYSGEVLLMEDGSIYEVDSRDTFFSGRWRNDSRAIVIDNTTLVNLDESRGIVQVRQLRRPR